MISALTFAVANHSPKGRESQLSVTVDDFEEAQEQKEPGEQREHMRLPSEGKQELEKNSSSEVKGCGDD